MTKLAPESGISSLKYRIHNSNAEWRNLSNSCLLPFGLVDIKVEFPDNKYVMETFYFIDDMTFASRNETMFSTELHLDSRHVISAKVDECENLSVEMTDKKYLEDFQRCLCF